MLDIPSYNPAQVRIPATSENSVKAKFAEFYFHALGE
jgi:hypothetical protein